MTTTPVGSVGGDAKADAWLKLATAAFERVTKQFEKKTGLPLDKLGPLAAAAAADIKTMLESGAKQEGTVKSELVMLAFQQLGLAHQKDEAKNFSAGDPPATKIGAHLTVPSDTKQFLKKAEGGRFELTGLVGPEHLLTKLLETVGINPKSISANVAALVEELAVSNNWRDLGNKSVWNTLAGKFREVAIEEGLTGGPKVADLKRAEANARAVMPKSTETTQQADLGLNKTATRTSNTGSKTNSTAIRAQLLTGLKASTNGADAAASSLADAILGDLKISGVSKGLRSDVVSALKEALKDQTSPDGSVRPLEVYANAYRLVLANIPDEPKSVKDTFRAHHDFAVGMASLMKGRPLTPSLEAAFAQAAVGGLTDLVLSTLGQPLTEPSPHAQRKLFGILTQYAKKEPLAEALRLKNTTTKPRVDAPKTQRTEAPKTERTERTDNTGTASEEARARVDQWLSGWNIDASMKNAPKVKQLESVLLELAGQGVSPDEVAKNGLEWLHKETGLFESRVKQFDELLGPIVKDAGRAEELYDQAKAELASLREQLAEASPEAKEHLSRAVNMAERTFASSEKILNEKAMPLYMMQNDVLNSIGHYIGNKEEFLAKHKELEEAAAAGAGGANGGGGDNPPIDFGGGRDRGPTGPRAFQGPDAPHPDDSITMQRAKACSLILSDRSLSIEDKIFLFMMTFLSFTDRERADKLNEIASMDKLQSLRAQKIERKNREGKSQGEELVKARNELRDANSALASAKTTDGDGSPAAMEAQRKVDDVSAKVKGCQGAVENIRVDIDRLQRESDSAPQSHEVKFTELQRLSQLRDNILNMARSMMDTSNRNIEKVFR
jgi:hypothetical protein